jgi:hypothetical protein
MYFATIETDNINTKAKREAISPSEKQLNTLTIKYIKKFPQNNLPSVSIATDISAWARKSE